MWLFLELVRASECEIKIRSNYNQLPDGERNVADVILSDIDAVLDYSIDDLAKASKTSKATVVRFCHHIGYRGLKDLKVSIAKTQSHHKFEAPRNLNIERGDGIDVIKQKIMYGSIQALQDTMDLLNENDIRKAIDILHESRYIEILGVGGSATVARLALHNFRKLGKRVTLYTDPDRDFYMTSQYTKGDVIFAVSISGETESIIKAVSYAKSNGAYIISLTGVDKSTLKNLSDISLPAMSRSNVIPGDQSYVRLAQGSIVNLLFAGVCAKNDWLKE